MSKYADPTREHALWLADKLAGNDYVQEAAEMLRRWPEGGPCQRTFNAIAAETEVCAGYVARPQSKAESDSKPPSGKGTWTRDHAEQNQIEMIDAALASRPQEET